MRARSFTFLTIGGLVAAALVAPSCGGDGEGETGNTAGTGGSAGEDGSSGSAGTATGGEAGAAGSGNAGGAGGSAGSGTGGLAGDGAADPCGNGKLDTGEKCDTAISSGTGSCPTACDDSDACTTDGLAGSECTTECVHGAITAPQNGDGCCPSGASSANDDDCAAGCGNGVVDSSEKCDTAITSGSGSCPVIADCDDSQACTVNAVSGTGCQAECDFSGNVAASLAGADGCCPSGATDQTDSDCSALCGNGVKDSGETCDTTATGADACPTSCADSNACTNDSLISGGTCNASCSNQAITAPTNGDGCCPPGTGNANNDDDCNPVCGNLVVESGEQCDGGASCDPVTCQKGPTAFRVTQIYLRDPHLFANITTPFPLGCQDITNTVFNQPGVNPQFNTAITTDTGPGDAPDGMLDLNLLMIFRPLDQAAAGGNADFYQGDCPAPYPPASCGMKAGFLLQPQVYVNQSSGTCLSTITGTTRASYTPAIIDSTAPCSVTNSSTVSIDLGGIAIQLEDARIAGRYVGNPATSIIQGLMRGFVSATQADTVILPANLPIVGGKPLKSLLRGATTTGGFGCGSSAAADDRDDYNGTNNGWYFYMNFEAAAVTWTGT